MYLNMYLSHSNTVEARKNQEQNEVHNFRQAGNTPSGLWSRAMDGTQRRRTAGNTDASSGIKGLVHIKFNAFSISSTFI